MDLGERDLDKENQMDKEQEKEVAAGDFEHLEQASQASEQEEQQD